MLALFIVGEALVDGMVINGVMPGNVTEGILPTLEGAALEHPGMGESIAAAAVTLGGMHRDVAGTHLPNPVASIFSLGNVGLGDGAGRRTPAA